MSHLTIKRRRTESVKSKLHSQQSRNLVPRHSIGRILNDSLSKRRFTTHNSPDHSQSSQTMKSELEQAKQVYKNKNTKNALVLFKKLYKKYPKNTQVPYFIGSCLLNQSNYESALGYYKICLSFDQYVNKNVYIYMAICYKALGKYREAIQILQTACQKNHKFKDAYFYKGKLHLKRKEYQQASACFRKCVRIDVHDELSKFFLAESLRSLGLNQEALQKFDSLQKQSKKFHEKSLLKKIQVLIDMGRIKEAYDQINKVQQNMPNSCQLNFLKGLCDYELGNYSDSTTFLQLSLSSNINEPYLGKALKILLQIKIKEKDFFGAEHLITRSKFINKNQQELQLYYKLVQGINDLIKRRTTEAQQKLEKVYSNCQKPNLQAQKFLQEVGSSFYAYCLFSQQKYEKALQVYKKTKQKKQKQIARKVEDYNVLICEGVVYHKKKHYAFAEQKFKQASKLLQNKIEPAFLICVNLVQENREAIENQQIKKKVFQRLSKQFKSVQKIQPQSSLFLFYQSLVLLYQGEDACQTIQKAISSSEQQISQYFFIQALALSLNGQHLKGLESINKAIQLDHSIPQFFKQRSKYYYVLQRYDEAVADIVGTLQETGDQQAKLLLTFYYYMTQQYGLSLQILKQVSQHCAQDKFKEFEMALNFRLHKYDQCGTAGTIINSIITKQAIDLQYLENVVDTHINQRQNYSQFNVYFFHLILSAYFFYQNQLDPCLQHLFGALQQIQMSAENEESYAALSELMLNQIKFNIAITSLLKESSCHNQKDVRNFADTSKYITMFMNETQDSDFINIMAKLLEYVESAKEKTPLPQSVPKVIDIYEQIPKVSNDLPQISIFLNESYYFKTKFLVLYPQKLKFNICPQFDESFLFNFDVDKIESKLCPPWYNLHQGQLIFTDKIRNESVMISESQKPQTPSLIMSPSPMPENLREKFKLDEAVERKLQKLIQVNKKKEPGKRGSSTNM